MSEHQQHSRPGILTWRDPGSPRKQWADARTRIAVRGILLATDFSPSSEAALLYASAIARRYGSRIYLAHVIPSDAHPLVPPELTSVLLKQAQRDAERQMAQVLISGRLRAIPHQVLLGQGGLWTVLSRMIEDHEIDLVVVGTHGRRGLQKMLLGSVAEQIFRLAPCPVLTVGPKAFGEVPNDAEFRQILYATDFKPSSERAAAYVLSLVQEHQARLTLLHVVRGITETSPPSTAALTQSLTERLRGFVPAEAELRCDPVFAIEFGAPAEGIIKAAEERKTDLIVLGAHQSAYPLSHLPPATAYRVVCQASCPVLTVRE